MNYVANFSGGKDSTAMLITIKENDLPLDEIIYCDVGNWMWDISDHIKKVEEFMDMDITIIDISKQIKDSFEKLGFPRFTLRYCTGLKRDNLNKYCRKYRPSQLTQYIGFAYDEQKRMKKGTRNRGTVSFPLIDYKLTEKDALELCYEKGFDFNNIYDHHSRLNCWCCPLQKIPELEYLYKNYPEKWDKLKEMQSESRTKFRKEASIFDLDKRFKKGG